MVSKLLKTHFLLPILLLCALTVSAQQQPVQVSVALAPPYPTHWEDYAQMKGQIVVTLTNTSQTFLQLRLVPTVTGMSNGVSATLKPGYRPATPLTLGPLETKVLTGGQLQALNMGLSLQHLDVKGVDIQQIIKTETVPEGAYDLCVRAFDFNSSTQLSKDGIGCSPFNITWYDPPVVINPADQSHAQALNPQFLNFMWTPSGLGGITRYRLMVMDLTVNNLFNPNDAFDMGFPPFFQKDYLVTVGYPYSSAEPPLTIGHKYAVRVVAYDPAGNIKFKNGGKSAVIVFTYGLLLPGVPAGGGGGNTVDIPFDDLANAPQPPVYNVPDPTDPNTCMAASACEIVMPPATGIHAPQVGDTVAIGKFLMIVNSIAGGSGEGTIYVPFLKTKVRVQFQNLEVNGNNQAVNNSKAWAKIDQPNLVEQAMANDPSGNLPPTTKVKDLNNYVTSAKKLVSKFAGPGSEPIGVPFALDNAKMQNLIFLGLMFNPTKAQANVVFGMPVQEAMNNDWLLLGTKGICLRPNGFGVDAGVVALASDKSVAITDKTAMLFKGGADKTYLNFDCHGITKVQVSGGFEFSRDMALPLNANGTVVAAPAKFAANFSATVTNGLNWTAAATSSHPKFALPGAQDIAFSAEDLFIDQSETESVTGMQFPANHPKFGKSANEKKAWKGVYLGTVSVTLPSWMKGKNDAAVSIVDMKDLLMDKTGLWVKVTKTGQLVKFGEGSVAGWGFSIDTLKLDIQHSSLAGGGIGGKLRLPVAKTGLKYSATISAGSPEANFSFGVNTQDQVTIDAFIAKAVFAPNSSIFIKKDGGKYIPEATLNGAITVGWTGEGNDKPTGNNAVSSFQLPTLKFSTLHIKNDPEGKPKILEFKMELDNQNPKKDQGTIAHFPLKLSPPVVDCSNGNLSLGLGLSLTLSQGETGKNGLSGSAGFTIYGKYDAGEKRFVYDKTLLDSITIDVDVSAAHITGKVGIYSHDDEFGDGFKGSISATIRGVGVGVSATLQVGNMGTYDYFYFDGLFRYDPGFAIPGAPLASFYGFGGGFWYNMSPKSALGEYDYDAFGKTVGNMSAPGTTQTGVVFTPKKGSSGFKAKVLFGLSGGKTAGGTTFNGDLEFRMYFSAALGVDSMVLDGHGYVMQPMEKRDKALVEGNVYMKIDFVTPSFTLVAGLNVSIGKVLEGGATLAMHFSKNEWYVHLGKWDTESQIAQDYPWNDQQRCHLNVDLKVFKATVHCYFMMGSNMPGLPPLPVDIRNCMEGQEGNSISDNRKTFPAFDKATPGFGFGVGVKMELHPQVLIFYADIKFQLGFDMLLKKYPSGITCDGKNIGINNWYAMGQAYAQLDMHAGLVLDLWVWEGKWELFHVNVTAVLMGSFPNPNYFYGLISVHGEVLNGLITVDRSFKFETGEKPCINPSPFGQYPIVSSMEPQKLDGTTDKIRAYDDIRLAFNFPKGEFEVSDEMSPNDPPHVYYYKIEEFSVKHGNTKLAVSPIEYAPDGYAARYKPVDNGGMWPGDANLRLYLKVNGYEKGKNKPATDKPEVYDFEFKTGPKPTKFVMSKIKASSPLPRQRFYMNNQSNGFVEWDKGFSQCDLFNKNNDDPKLYDISKTKIRGCFTGLNTNKRTYTDVICMGEKVSYVVPNNLKKSTIYSFEIVKELTTLPKPAKEAEDMGGGGGWGTGGGNDQDGWEYESGSWTADEVRKYIDGVYTINKMLLPDTTVKHVRYVLYKIYFRTSKFNSLEEKMATYSVKGVGYYKETINGFPEIRKNQQNNWYVNENSPTVIEHPIAFISGQEPVDMYEAYGYTVDPGDEFQVVQPPLLHFGSRVTEKFPTEFYETYGSITNHYHQDYTAPEIAKMEVGRFKGALTIPPDGVQDRFSELDQQGPWKHYRQFWRASKYGSVLPYKPGNIQATQPMPPLSDAEISAAKAQAPQQGPPIDMNNMMLQVNAPSSPAQPLNNNLGVDPTTLCVPVVDFSGSVVHRDFRLYMGWPGWGYIRTNYGFETQQSFLLNAHDYMEDYIKPRSGDQQYLIINGKEMPYKIH